jgi:hypothetical protein
MFLPNVCSQQTFLYSGWRSLHKVHSERKTTAKEIFLVELLNYQVNVNRTESLLGVSVLSFLFNCRRFREHLHH